MRTLFFENESYPGPAYLFSDAKAFSIFSRSHFHLLDKCSAQCLFIAKAGNACDLLKRCITRFQVLPRGFNSKGSNPSRRSRAEIPFKLTSKSSRTHRDKRR